MGKTTTVCVICKQFSSFYKEYGRYVVLPKLTEKLPITGFKCV